MKEADFLQKLQEEAALQAQLQQRSLLPHQFDDISRFIGSHTWQVLLVSSFISAVIVTIL